MIFIHLIRRYRQFVKRLKDMLSPDPGWLFIVAGLAVLAAGVLVPSHQDVQELRYRASEMNDALSLVTQRLARGAQLLEEFDRRDPILLRRLAATQLNLIPADEKVVVPAAQLSADFSIWLDTGVNLPRPREFPVAESKLARIALGEHRLWLFAGAAVCVFIGLLLTPVPSSEVDVEASPHGKEGTLPPLFD